MAATLLPYQTAWVRDPAPFKVCEKSRRIGMSWCESYDAVLHAGGDRGDVYYQSYAKDMTTGFVSDCADWAERLQIAADAAGEVLIDLGDKRSHPAYRLPMASGRQIVAMTSAPRAFRSKGRPGDRAVIDEAAFVDDLGEVLKAAMAFRIWGGEVRVLSTHNGDGSPFAALVEDAREGRSAASLHTVTFADAVAKGLHARIRETGATDLEEAEWVAAIRAEYGSGAAEELDCVPSSGGGSWIAWEDIRRCERADAGDPALAAGGDTVLAVDVARRGDLWVLVAAERVGDVVWIREIVARRNIPFAEQRAIVADAVRRYRPRAVAVDQTGMGEAFVEQLQDVHGSVVEGVLLTGPRRLDCATALREQFEDARVRIPADEALRADLHSVKREAGAAGAAPRLVVSGDTDGHADRFWAMALAAEAHRSRAVRFDYRPVRPPRLAAHPHRLRRRPDHSGDIAPGRRPLVGGIGRRAGAV